MSEMRWCPLIFDIGNCFPVSGFVEEGGWTLD